MEIEQAITIEQPPADESASVGESTPAEQRHLDSHPRRVGYWLLAAILFVLYMMLQVVFALPVAGYLMIVHQPRTMEEMQALMLSDAGLWMMFLAVAFAALVTVLAAWVWPWIWDRLLNGGRYGLDEWIAWRRPAHLKLWMVPLVTVAFLVGLSLTVLNLTGSAEVEAQTQLFSVPNLQIISTIVVSTIVPIAEEILFRGALYNALLPGGSRPAWQRHLIPLAVTTISFTAIHLLAGFQTFSSLLLLAMLAFFLGTLRALTGSVQSSIAGHMTWNLLAALSLIFVN